jgi:hypothetical protein
MEEVEPEDDRPRYMAIQVVLLDCTPANYDHDDGEPASIVTVGRKCCIEPLVFNMQDSRRLVAKLLVALATYEDKFAQKLLDENFGSDQRGNFQWPCNDRGSFDR